MAKRNLYLSNVPVEEALEKFLAALETATRPGKHRCEKVPVADALGRITAEAVFALCSSPAYNAAAMDGIAVASAATAGAAETNPVTLVRGKDFVYANTGEPVKQPFDAVIMAEDIQEADNGNVIIREAAASWQHIRPIGEDIVTGEMILPSRHVIRPIDIGVLLSAGIIELEVIIKPKVALFPTGNEIIEPGENPKEGQVIESNTRMFHALVQEGGGEACRFQVVP
ncbi:MAG: molybdopterin biosynthesis protein, partial [Spirochaetes bacterium]|nr:molybdopterin biosynthesis protein [Spirochaetota bacterium]